jgi:DNA invertase Pin-like site-specific DNA recombinase
MFSRLFVYRLDRLSRGTICEMLNLLQEFKGAGCQVVSCADSFPLDGPFGEFVVSVIAMCASMEREAIANRVASARARVEASGGSWGRPRVLDDAKRERIDNMQAKGYSVRKIARLVKVSTSTVFDHLKRKTNGTNHRTVALVASVPGNEQRPANGARCSKKHPRQRPGRQAVGQ